MPSPLLQEDFSAYHNSGTGSPSSFYVCIVGTVVHSFISKSRSVFKGVHVSPCQGMLISIWCTKHTFQGFNRTLFLPLPDYHCPIIPEQEQCVLLLR